MRRSFILACLLVSWASARVSADEMEEADKLFRATLFEAAAERYEALLNQTSNGGSALTIRSRLVENFFMQNQYEKALKVAQAAYFTSHLPDPDLEMIRLRGLYFEGLSRARLGQQEAAIQAFESYLNNSRPLDFENEVRLELGLIHLQLGNLRLARSQLESISGKSQKPQIYCQAVLNLAKIHLKENELEKALHLLTDLDQKLPPNDLLRPEYAFLSGETCLRLNDFSRAIDWLEKALLPEAPWQAEALYQLGWAHLHCAPDSHHLQQAENIFQTLINQSPLKEKAALALAQCYLNQSLPDKAAKLLSDNSLPASLEGQGLSLLFNARAASSFAEKERYYQQLTEGPYQNTTVFAEGWFERGLNAYEECTTRDSAQVQALALRTCSEAYHLLKNSDETRANLALCLTGRLHFRQKHYDDAEKPFLHIIQNYFHSPLITEALFWAAKCSDEKGDREKSRDYRRRLFEEYPNAPCSDEAYFNYYRYRDYVQGDRAAIKHLQSMRSRFPDSVYLVIAYYLIGMDEMRDRKTVQGKWIRKKNLNDAIDAFQEVETTFDRLDAAKKVPAEERVFFINVRYRATLERASANLAIAEESQGAKRRIFLQYAAEVLDQIRNDFKDPHHPLTSLLAKGDAYPSLLEESSYWLAQTHIKMQDDRAAETLLLEILDTYRSSHIATGYYLSRTWYELGLIAMHRQEFTKALQAFSLAEKAAQENLISSDQKIDLWIQQSLCHREMKDLDQAMLILSKAINDDTISSLRVKAMYLRAEIYALQGRHDLARKQLEATAKKGGEWALKAKGMVK